MTPEDFLSSLIKLKQEKGKEYGEDYQHIGTVLSAMFPRGSLLLASPEDFGRLAMLVMMVTKIMRYCTNFDKGGHADSLRDLDIYAALLQHLDDEECTS
jgi:hypothetical protein